MAKNDMTTAYRHEGRVVQLPQSHVQHNGPPPGRDGVGVGWVELLLVDVNTDFIYHLKRFIIRGQRAQP